MTERPRLTVSDLRVRAVSAPMPRPLHTSSGTIETAPLVLVDLLTEEGITGCAYVFCYTPLALRPVAELLSNLAPVIRGDPLAPAVIEQKLQARFRLAGAKGPIAFALAGIDMAAWDALAKACGLPLATLLGGAPRPIPAYNSCGLGIIGRERAATEAQELAAGFRAIKVRLGYPTLEEDVAVVRTVRRAVGEQVVLMSDYNQVLSVPEAVRRARVLDDEGLYWIEEPTLADDHDGHAQVRREARTAIQTGENWWGPRDLARSLAAGASDFGMLDVGKIGGVTGWMRAAALAEAQGLPLSSHLFPEFSAHLLAVTPTCHWLEYVDWATAILKEPIAIRDGHAIVPKLPGAGVAWDDAAVERCRVA